MQGKQLWVGGLVLLAMLVFASAALASVYNGTVELTCTDWDASGTGSHVLDRDNTGTGQEALRIDITDGAGTLIYTFSYSNTIGTFPAGIGTGSYASAPQANPITFTLTSLAGNGLPEQIDYVAQGSCAGLPTVGGGAAACTNPMPSSFVMRSIPAGALAYFEASESAYAGFNLPAGTWFTGGAENGFVEVWIACQGSNVFVPEGNVVG